MVNRDGQTKTKLPTQYRTNKSSKKKILAKEGNKLDYQIIKCVVCNKRKMEKYNLMDEKGQFITINKCKNCKYTNASVVTSFYESDGGDPYVVNYFNPARLEDKS
jgi:hypothetical protein